MKNSKKWQRAELLVFTIVTIINMMPFVATRFFPSIDGASHLSNSNIINQLVFHNNELFHKFFMINPEPVPNWTAHLLISLFSLVMPAFLAEKILIIILLTGMPFAFRNLLHTISPKNTLFSFLIFPFTHSMFFFFGFFNFCMAILLLLITLNYWLRQGRQPMTVKKTILLSILVALTYFSHIVIFGVLLILIAVHILTDATMGLLCKTSNAKATLKDIIKKILVITLSAIVPLILFGYFFYSRPGTREITRIAREELVKFLVNVRPLISLNGEIEGKQTTIYFYLLSGLIGIGIIAFVVRLIRSFIIKSKAGEDINEEILPRFHFWWLLVAASILLGLYFKLPDAYGTASNTNFRISFVFFLEIGRAHV